MSYSGNALFLGKKISTGPFDPWTIGLFLKIFLTIFLGYFIDYLWGGGERGRKIISMKQTFITQGGVGDGLLICMRGRRWL